MPRKIVATSVRLWAQDWLLLAKHRISEQTPSKCLNALFARKHNASERIWQLKSPTSFRKGDKHRKLNVVSATLKGDARNLKWFLRIQGSFLIPLYGFWVPSAIRWIGNETVCFGSSGVLHRKHRCSANPPNFKEECVGFTGFTISTLGHSEHCRSGSQKNKLWRTFGPAGGPPCTCCSGNKKHRVEDPTAPDGSFTK